MGTLLLCSNNLVTGPGACVQRLNSAVCRFTDQGDVFQMSSSQPHTKTHIKC